MKKERKEEMKREKEIMNKEVGSQNPDSPDNYREGKTENGRTHTGLFETPHGSLSRFVGRQGGFINRKSGLPADKFFNN